ncbi:MAG: DUF1330 domain-containing protein [Acidobacteria bacterium]|nr:DUF1330 domain-containing protein [Acidobacteriota bacterium]
MPAYFIMRVDVHDAEVYEKHIGQAVEAVKQSGGEFLARGGRSEQVSGEGRGRNIIVRFPDFETAKACIADPRIQETLRLTAGACTRDSTLVEGL